MPEAGISGLARGSGQHHERLTGGLRTLHGAMTTVDDGEVGGVVGASWTAAARAPKPATTGNRATCETTSVVIPLARLKPDIINREIIAARTAPRRSATISQGVHPSCALIRLFALLPRSPPRRQPRPTPATVALAGSSKSPNRPPPAVRRPPLLLLKASSVVSRQPRPPSLQRQPTTSSVALRHCRLPESTSPAR